MYRGWNDSVFEQIQSGVIGLTLCTSAHVSFIVLHKSRKKALKHYLQTKMLLEQDSLCEKV